MNNQEAEQAVSNALHAGFRYIDTANMYQNEEGVGKALEKSMIPREELFISSKLGVLDTNFEGAKKRIWNFSWKIMFGIYWFIYYPPAF